MRRERKASHPAEAQRGRSLRDASSTPSSSGHKRFSLEGAESLIPLLDALLNAAADDGMDEVVIGMAHRGRLNVLANIIGKSSSRIFRRVRGRHRSRYDPGIGRRQVPPRSLRRSRVDLSGRKIEVSVAANPSHLEAVDPVLEGIVRAKQERLRESSGTTRSLPVLDPRRRRLRRSGRGRRDAQPVSQLRGYRTGGTVHVVVNNQVGFTTSTLRARSSFYATDVAKTVQAPIFHVNGDDPEAVVQVARLAFAFRQAFHKDVVIDMICYRRLGHNEGDEPSYTQPRHVPDHRSSTARFGSSTWSVSSTPGALPWMKASSSSSEFRGLLDRAFEETRALPPQTPRCRRPEVESPGPLPPRYLRLPVETIVAAITTSCRTDSRSTPSSMRTGPRSVAAMLGRGTHGLGGGRGAGLRVALALEGHWIRLAGEDSKRGPSLIATRPSSTSRPESRWIPLQDLTAERARLRIVDSLLSEFAAVGFEYGYSIEMPRLSCCGRRSSATSSTAPR